MLNTREPLSFDHPITRRLPPFALRIVDSPGGRCRVVEWGIAPAFLPLLIGSAFGGSAGLFVLYDALNGRPWIDPLIADVLLVFLLLTAGCLAVSGYKVSRIRVLEFDEQNRSVTISPVAPFRRTTTTFGFVDVQVVIRPVHLVGKGYRGSDAVWRGFALILGAGDQVVVLATGLTAEALVARVFQSASPRRFISRPSS